MIISLIFTDIAIYSLFYVFEEVGDWLVTGIVSNSSKLNHVSPIRRIIPKAG